MRFERNLIVEFASVHATEESATTSGGGGGRRRKKEKVATHDKDGKRARYFADDDRHDLKSLFEREKLSTAEDQNGMMSRLAGRAIERTDEEYDLDDVFTSRASRKDGKAEEERERERAIAEHQRERRWVGCGREGGKEGGPTGF